MGRVTYNGPFTGVDIPIPDAPSVFCPRGSAVTVPDVVAAALLAQGASWSAADAATASYVPPTPPSYRSAIINMVGAVDNEAVVRDSTSPFGFRTVPVDLGLMEIAALGESWTQHGTQGWEDNWTGILEARGVFIRNMGKSGSKIAVGDLETPNVTGVSAGQQSGGGGQITDSATRELRSRPASSRVAYSDAPVAITTVNPLMGQAPWEIMHAPNDLALFGDSQAVVDVLGNVYRHAICLKRACYLIGPNNTTFFTYTGAAGRLAFGFQAGSVGLPSGSQARTMSAAGTVAFTMPTDILTGQELDVFNGLLDGANGGTVDVKVNGTHVPGSPFTIPAGWPTNYATVPPWVMRVPLTAAMAGGAVVITYNAGAIFGGIGFQASTDITDTDGLPAPGLVADCPRLPQAAQATWFTTGNGWTGPYSDAGAARMNAKLAAIALEFDRFVQIVPIDAAINNSAALMNPGDVHVNARGARAVAEAHLVAMRNWHLTSAEVMMARPMVKRPWPTRVILPGSVAGYSWAQPTAETELLGSAVFRINQDLTRYSEYRLIARVGTAFGSGAKLYLKYSLDQEANWQFLTYDGSAAGGIPEAVGVATTGIRYGAWGPMHPQAHSGAQECSLRVMGTATVAATGVLNGLEVQFR